MDVAARAVRRSRTGAYATLFLLIAPVVFISHLPFLKLPYYWDEAGQFVPAALDLMRDGAWIPHSAVPNIHPPAVVGYLALFWRVAGYAPAATRAAMLLLACFTVLAAMALAIELSKEARGMPALLAAALLWASPLFFAQSLLALLDVPATLFTTVALLLFLRDRIALSAAACTVLVMAKETGLVVPLVFALWLIHERRWRDAAWFLAPAVTLAGWIAVLARSTGHWAGNPGFAQYNLEYPLHPMRLALAIGRRAYYLGFANCHWVGLAAVLYAWRRTGLFRSRAWRIAWLVAGVQVAAVTLAGGAVLERYLLPAMPIVYAAMTAALSFLPRAPRLISSAALLGGIAAGNFVNPPYPFPYEDNLAFTSFAGLHAEAASYLERRYPDAAVWTAWPLTAELSNPDLGYVSRRVAARVLKDFAPHTIESLDWSRVQVLAVYSLEWDPRLNIAHSGLFRAIWRRYYGHVPQVTERAGRALVPFPLQAHFARGGQWIDLHVNPEMGTYTPPVRAGAH
jgi:4-amino-4-deoxy-L-arabinose transferase-like glycosyltransferase